MLATAAAKEDVLFLNSLSFWGVRKSGGKDLFCSENVDSGS